MDSPSGNAVKDITDKNFGVVIAFWLPGVILLWGLVTPIPVYRDG